MTILTSVLGLLAFTLVSAGVNGQAVATTPSRAYWLAVSTQPDRASSQPVAGKAFARSATVYIFMRRTQGIKRVRYYLDDATMSRPPRHVENHVPYDFAGTAIDGSAMALDLSTLSVGSHSATAAIESWHGRTRLVSARFSVVSASPSPSPSTSTSPSPSPSPSPSSPSPRPSASAVDPSGQLTPRGDLPGWRQIFVDDFHESVPLGKFPAAVSDKWTDYPNTYHDTSGHGVYWPQKVVSIAGGLMDMRLHTETINGVPRHLVAGPIPRLPTSDPAVTAWNGAAVSYTGQRYGRYAMRFRAEPVAGYKTAWLLWSRSNSKLTDGEIDFPEGNLNSRVCAYMHHMHASSDSDQEGRCSSETYPQWHTAVLEWTPTACRFTLDGDLLLTGKSRIPSTPMRWVLQTETDLSGVPPANSASGHIKVDWVAVYAPS